MKKWKYKGMAIGICCIIISGCTLSACGKETADVGKEACKTGIFSWEEEYILPAYEEDVELAMDVLGCQAIYHLIFRLSI